jgi:hypothetical protein
VLSIVREITVQCLFAIITTERDGYFGVATAISRTMLSLTASIAGCNRSGKPVPTVACGRARG